MRRLETQQVEHFNETEIDEPAKFEVILPGGRHLDYGTLVANTPAVTSGYDGYYDPQLVIGTEEELPQWDEDRLFPVGRLDKIHGRTLEVLADSVAIEDQYGNTFASLCIKGSNLSDPHFFRTLTAARGHIIYGLQESLVMERVIRASQVLRAHDVDTEYICGVALPESFPLSRDDSGIDDKKLVSLPNFLEHMASRFASETEGDDLEVMERKATMIERFKDCDYLVSYRAMDCPYRLGELTDKDKFASFKDFVSQNMRPGEFSQFIQEHDALDYIQSLFSYCMARNIARMHQAGIAHSFLVPLNVSALGSIIDLDSCKGETLGLGDEAITQKDEITDVVRCFAGIKKTILKIYPTNDDARNHLSQQSAIHRAGEVFIEYYLKERFEAVDEKVEFLAAMIENYKVHDELDEDGVFLLDFCHTANRVWHRLGAGEYPKDLPLYDQPIEPHVERHETFMNHLPAKLFRDLSEIGVEQNAVGAPHNMYVDQLEQIGEKSNVYHPISGLVRNACLEELVECYRRGSITSPEELLFLAGVVASKSAPQDEQNSLALNQAQQYINDLTEVVVSQLGHDDPTIVESQLQPYVEQLKVVSEGKLGILDMTVEDEPNVNILYLKDDADYLQVFDALGIGEQTDIAEMEPYRAYGIRALGYSLPSDAVILCDYEMVEYTSSSTVKDRLRHALFIPQTVAKPLVFIQGLSTGTPRVLLSPGPLRTIKDLEREPTAYSYSQLLSIVAPSYSINPQTRLVDDNTDTRKASDHLSVLDIL